MIRLGFNVDHVATLRNARGESYPSPVQAAVMAELGGADNITCHLREDRRHIRDRDVELLRETIQIPLNFEMAVTPDMLSFACRLKPAAVTLVPEKRHELTTEGGLDLAREPERIEAGIRQLRDAGILVSLFVDPDPHAMLIAKKMGAHAIEIHTGHFCREFSKLRTTADQQQLLKPLRFAAERAHAEGLQVHAGHGLNYSNAHWTQSVSFCEEANIGHAIVARAVFCGLEKAVSEMKRLLNEPSLNMSPKI